MYPTTIGTMNAEAKLFGHGTISGLKDGEEVKFQTLTFQETDYQKLNSIKEILQINGKMIYPTYILDEFGNKYAVFTIRNNGDFNYTIAADLNTSSILFEMVDYDINSSPNEVMNFLEPSEKIESSSTQIEVVEKNKLINNSFLDSLDSTVLWVNDYVEYAQGNDFQKYYLLQRSALETLMSRKGVCDEFANLGAALLRSKNIPTRLSIGITFDGREWGNHAWIEVYHNNFGWIPSDPTFRESGFVDATHIKMGSFSDVTLSLAKSSFPSTANVTFDTQGTLPEITVKDKGYFNDVTLESTTTEIKTQQWNDFNLTIKNRTNGTLVAPIKVAGPNTNYLGIVACVKDKEECLLVDESKQSVTLKPQETKEITFKFYPNITLDNEHKIETSITLFSLGEPYTKNITIVNGTFKNEAELRVKDITPIVEQGKVTLQISAVNLFPEDKLIDINISDGTTVRKTQEIISAFSTKTINPVFEQADENWTYYVTITTPSAIYSQTIVGPDKTSGSVIVKPVVVKPTIVEQKVDTKKEVGMFETLMANPIVLVIALLSGIAVMLLGLFWVNKHYM
jgi:hypothetical protein